MVAYTLRNTILSLSVRFPRSLLLLLMLTVGVNRAWGQTDYSGVYYIGSNGYNANTPASNYYLCPTEEWCYYQATDDFTSTDNGMPFLTTYKCRNGVYNVNEKAVWIVEKHPSQNYYYIKRAYDGKYIVFNGQIRTTSNADRMRVHLEAMATPDDNTLFIITKNGNAYNIQAKADVNAKYWTVNGGNKDALTGQSGKVNGPTGYTNTAGIIGIYQSLDGNSNFYFEKATIDPPTITNNYNGTITIAEGTGATIYYTTDGTTPTISTPTSGTTSITVTLDGTITVIKAIAKSANDIFPTTATTYTIPVCNRPVINVVNDIVTITCDTPGANIYYTINGTEATPSSTVYSGSFSLGDATYIRAIATLPGYLKSSEAVYAPVLTVHSSSEIVEMNRSYILASDFSSTNPIGTSDNPFQGTIDGQLNTLSGLNHPLVAYADGATIKNVILDNISISGTNVGAICNEATGDTRIYNCGVLATRSTVGKDDDGYDHISSCSSSISGTGNVGGIVGLLDGSSRVINCFSYANVSGGSHVGGIVGYNNVATTASNLQTMVMNCMFYGEVSGTSIAPIYNGKIITNDGDADGVNNFNYFRLESAYIQNTDIIKVYNCALGAETRFLQRFEFYRYLLNSNRELAAWWASTSTTTVTKDEMMKWVMEPTQIGSTKPYPILKTPGKYASIINYTPSTTAYDNTEANRNKGFKLTSEGDGGVLHVTIQMGHGAHFSAPSGARLKDGENGTFDLTITDKDFEHYNFNYGKVQLPYYNDYCVGNYTENRVVTGWKIVDITGGTAGSYSTDADDVTYTNGELTATPYNFADRKCTDKDLYSVSGRVFNQGAYWDVPEGVTAITIQPYWGKAVYLADAYWDVVYQNGSGNGTAAGTAYDAMTTASNVTTVGGGQHYVNRTSSFNGQTVYTSLGGTDNAISSSALYAGTNEATYSARSVYDYAVVLVGNYHNLKDVAGGKKPYTITSVDLDGDNEPDYSFIMRFNARTAFHPVRYDFLNLIGLGMAQKTTGGTGSYNLGIMQPKYWFEVTNTTLFHVTQFEYSRSDKVKTPLILQGGVIEQWVTQQHAAGDRVSYFHVGGNVWFKEFHRGSHQDYADGDTPHPPLSVTGGDFEKFYLTGLYQSQAVIYDDNAECYINGGRFGEVAGAGMEGIGTSDGKGNITWIIDHADIKDFYGGGINFDKPVHGNIHTIISNSHVDVFCGGPKFGDMKSERTVTTTATNCTFGTYFGAGYGGNSYSRYAPRNHNNIVNFPHNDNQAGNHASWNAWLAATYTQSYNNTYGGVSTQFDYQFLPMSSNTENVARIFVEYVGFSLATTHDVTSNLTGCTITGNFYGGGSLGKVDGDVTSTLTNCSVNGSVFGAGFSASLPTVEVDSIGFRVEPYYYTDLGTYRTGVKGNTTTYTWEHGNAISIDKTNHILYTTEDLTTLGTVTGDVILNINGTTAVTGDVYGGGESSNAEGNSTVNVISGTLAQDIYGGGALANVDGNTKVNLIGGTIGHNVYGGGKGRLHADAVGTQGQAGYVAEVTAIAATVGNATVNLNGIDAADYKAEYTTLTREGDSGPYTVADDKKGCVVGGDIFGCNNLNGTPLGSVTVHVYKTQRAGATRITNTENVTNAKVEGTPGEAGSYDVKHVYGGGNLAAYEPTNALLDYSNTANQALVDAAHTTVIIDGCDRTSIYQVYGGGNAASTPATEVTVNGTFEIEEVFGGGNGKDALPNGDPNPGANVGYEDYSAYEDSDDSTNGAATAALREAHYSYGSGLAQVNIYGGRIHRVYGGSNTKGNVRRIAMALLDDLDTNTCEFDVDEAYGGGKSASMDGQAILEMKCIPGLNAAYGGAENADINNNVTLNITNGKFGQVFGGNNRGGRIGGSITVNVEETGCRPIIIGELYGGGNRAAYSVYGYKPETDNVGIVRDDYGKIRWLPLVENESITVEGENYTALDVNNKYADPVVNVKSFTSIGTIFGGGYGQTAVMVGNPTVNVNVVHGDKELHTEAKIETEGSIELYEQVVVGGSPTYRNLTYPTHEQGKIGAIENVFGGGNLAQVIGNTLVNIGTAASVDYVTLGKVNNVEETTPRTNITVVGADIRGNIFGGGNAANVTGDARVVIGREVPSVP